MMKLVQEDLLHLDFNRMIKWKKNSINLLYNTERMLKLKEIKNKGITQINFLSFGRILNKNLQTRTFHN
jgi:hypothetical protein